jgi:hypothetical protein
LQTRRFSHPLQSAAELWDRYWDRNATLSKVRAATITVIAMFWTIAAMLVVGIGVPLAVTVLLRGAP